MISFAPSLDAEAAYTELARLINFDIDLQHFRSSICRLHHRFKIFAATCPTPFIAPGLIITPEIRRQSEIYLPIAEITRIFNNLYHHALTYPPVLSSTPFYKALSWADVFVFLSAGLHFTADPARLLETLLSDRALLTQFLFVSFMPMRFYGGFGRYPGQVAFIRDWLGKRKRNGDIRFRCLDAACGTGEDSYGLASLLMEAGYTPEEIQIEGWTLEPLETWTAAHRRFPYDRQREVTFHRETCRLFELGYQTRICFRCADLTEIPCLPIWQSGIEGDFGQFDLILCNGLLSGPIMNKSEQLERVVTNLADRLTHGGILLVANSFHGGWKSKSRDDLLEALFFKVGLKNIDVGDGIGGLKF